MATTKAQPLTVLLRRTYKAPIERVFKAWTEPSQIQQWWGCNMFSKVQVQQDFRVGGTYEVIAEKNDGSAASHIVGVFKEIIPNEKVVYTWTNNSEEYPAKETLVTVEFIKFGDFTELVLNHTNFASEKATEGHNFGWSTALESLERVIA